MTPGALLESLITAFQIFKFEQPADRFLNDFFKKRRYMGGNDRRFVAESFYQALKVIPLLDWWINRSLNQPLEKIGIYPKDFPLARCRILAFTQLYRKMNSIEQLCNGQQYHPSPLNFVEKSLLKLTSNQDPIQEEMPLWMQLAVPQWMFPLLKKSLGDHYAAEIQALQQPAALDLRINTLKTTYEVAKSHLEVFKPSSTALSPFGLRLEGRPPLSNLQAYKQGWIEVQDEASQLVALMVNPQPKERILDLCAGAGGKTLGLAALMNNKGRIIAADTSAWRLKQATERFRRAGVHCVQTKLLDSDGLKWLNRQKQSFDKVLIDGPCSGSGTWRRNPDLKWRTTAQSLNDVQIVQQKLLEQTADLVKPNGHLVYATCSLLEEENQHQINLFLKNHPQYALVNLSKIWESFSGLPFPGKGEFFLETSPYRTRTDGFFVAALKRHE